MSAAANEALTIDVISCMFEIYLQNELLVYFTISSLTMLTSHVLGQHKWRAS